MPCGEDTRSVTTMNRRRTKRTLLLAFLFLGLIVLAVAGWTAQGVRRGLAGGGGRLAPAS
jgi:ABC-type transporter Mla subunit MlaD